jgi:hypothetical protein
MKDEYFKNKKDFEDNKRNLFNHQRLGIRQSIDKSRQEKYKKVQEAAQEVK